MVRCQSSILTSRTVAVGPATPALFTSTSMPPSCFTVSAAAAWTESQFEMSVLMPPCMSHTTTLPPSAAMRLATASPMPESPPVTTARLP